MKMYHDRRVQRRVLRSPVLLAVLVVLLVYTVALNHRGTAAECLVGPYSLVLGPDSVRLLWELDEPVDTEVLYWVSGSTDVFSAPGYPRDIDHAPRRSGDYDGLPWSASLEGLEPGHFYEYLVQEASGRAIGSGKFWCSADSSDDCALLLISDTQLLDRTLTDSHKRLEQTSYRMLEWLRENHDTPVGLVHIGDIVQEGQLVEEWHDLLTTAGFELLIERVAFLAASATWGHSSYCPAFERFLPFPEASKPYWSVDFGQIHIVVVDAMSSRFVTKDGVLLDDLREELESTLLPWTVVIMHRPLLPGELVESGDYPQSDPWVPARFDRFGWILEEQAADLVIGGDWRRFDVHLWQHGASIVAPSPIGYRDADTTDDPACQHGFLALECSSKELKLTLHHGDSEEDLSKFALVVRK